MKRYKLAPLAESTKPSLRERIAVSRTAAGAVLRLNNGQSRLEAQAVGDDRLSTGQPDYADPTSLANAIMDGWAEWSATLDKPEEDAAASAAYDRACVRLDGLLYAAEALPATPDSLMAKALAIAWEEFVSEERPGLPRAQHSFTGRIALDIHAIIMKREVGTDRQAEASPPRRDAIRLVDQIDFSSATMDELRALHDAADRVGGVAYAVTWQGGRKQSEPVTQLMQWLGDALAEVEGAAVNEARSRTPAATSDREARLYLLARSTIDDGSPDEAEAFARELMALVATEAEA